MRGLRSIGLVLCGLFACQPYDPPADPDTFRSCCGSLGTCVPQGLVPEMLQAQLSADSCDAALLCVPAALAEDRSAVPASCRALGDSEGRCLPACLPDVASRAQQLERSTCADGELCAPCFDPRTGADTHACHIGADPGPTEPAKVFASCCDERARCVPQAVISHMTTQATREQLGQDSCTGSDESCVPSAWLDEAPKFASCRALGDSEGRCVLDCLPAIAKQSDSLTRDSCQVGELCAPCFDPISGDDTKVCSQGADHPSEPAKTFASCCEVLGESRGRCVPGSVMQSRVSAADRDRLGSDSCAASDDLCVPDNWLDGSMPKPPLCLASGGFEGRCLSSCFPDVAARASALDVAGCAASELCVPCFDPLSGADTGACRTGGDEPEGAAQTFASCCDGGTKPLGRCVPHDLIARSASAADLARLGADVCSAPDALCVPETWIDSAQFTLPSCRALGAFEGRCMPSCLPDVSRQAQTLRQDDCSDGERCVPCFDPRTGTDSGACHVDGDAPHDAAPELESCCGSSGRCWPTSVLAAMLSSADLDRLGRDSCDSADRCVPNTLLDQDQAPATCRSLGDLEGRCVSRCLRDVADMSAQLTRSTCDESESCAPCYNPQTLEDTGACRTGTDQPRESARSFATCCGSGSSALGMCVPVEFLTTEQQRLPRDSCNTYDARCVPAQLFKTPTRPLDRCATVLQASGICFDTCFLSPTDASVLASCGKDGRCVPCSTVSATGIGCE